MGSKRDLAWSEANVRELGAAHVMNTRPGGQTPADDLLAGHRHLRLENSELSADQPAARIVDWLAARPRR
ncbi:hypothetical protein [Nocardioides sp.]|uniref:hypothetical protein n=1 Tax=Nocardioides sp. TaxID=35761 RepID=UPI0035657B68